MSEQPITLVKNPLSSYNITNLLHENVDCESESVRLTDIFRQLRTNSNVGVSAVGAVPVSVAAATTATAAITERSRTMTEAVDKFMCPRHHLSKVLKFCERNDGINAGYRLPPTLPCIGRVCQFSDTEYSARLSDGFFICESFSIDQLTSFKPKSSKATHRIKFEYCTDIHNAANSVRFELEVLKMGCGCLQRYISPNSVKDSAGRGACVVGEKHTTMDGNPTVSSVWIEIHPDLIAEIKLVSFEPELVLRQLRIPICGAAGVQLCKQSLDAQMHEIVSRARHRESDTKPMEKQLVKNYRLRANNNGSVAPLSKHMINPMIILYTSRENWSRTVKLSTINIHRRSTANGIAKINDIVISNTPVVVSPVAVNNVTVSTHSNMSSVSSSSVSNSPINSQSSLNSHSNNALLSAFTNDTRNRALNSATLSNPSQRPTFNNGFLSNTASVFPPTIPPPNNFYTGLHSSSPINDPNSTASPYFGFGYPLPPPPPLLPFSVFGESNGFNGLTTVDPFGDYFDNASMRSTAADNHLLNVPSLIAPTAVSTIDSNAQSYPQTTPSSSSTMTSSNTAASPFLNSYFEEYGSMFDNELFGEPPFKRRRI